MIRDRLIAAEPPASLSVCADRPKRRPVVTDVDLARLIAETFEYGDDCKSKLLKTWDSIRSTQDMVEKFNRQQQEQPR